MDVKGTGDDKGKAFSDRRDFKQVVCVLEPDELNLMMCFT